MNLQLRRVSAAARDALIAIAAKKWNVGAAGLTADNGKIFDSSSARSVHYPDTRKGPTNRSTPPRGGSADPCDAVENLPGTHCPKWMAATLSPEASLSVRLQSAGNAFWQDRASECLQRYVDLRRNTGRGALAGGHRRSRRQFPRCCSADARARSKSCIFGARSMEVRPATIECRAFRLSQAEQGSSKRARRQFAPRNWEFRAGHVLDRTPAEFHISDPIHRARSARTARRRRTMGRRSAYCL